MNDIRTYLPEGLLSPPDTLAKLAQVDVRQFENATQFKEAAAPSSKESWAKTVDLVHSSVLSQGDA